MPAFAAFRRRHERILVFSLLCAFWLGTYFGVAQITPFTAPRFLWWDPVWLLPFVPAFVVFYVSLYVMPALVFLVPYDAVFFRRWALAVAAALAVSSVAFLTVPLILPRPILLGHDIFSRLLLQVYAGDVSGNCLPSQHVMLAYLLAFGAGHQRPAWRWPTLAWATLIAASTVLVRQHYLVDVVSGFLVAWLAWRAVLLVEARKPRRLP